MSVLRQEKGRAERASISVFQSVPLRREEGTDHSADLVSYSHLSAAYPRLLRDPLPVDPCRSCI